MWDAEQRTSASHHKTARSHRHAPAALRSCSTVVDGQQNERSENGLGHPGALNIPLRHLEERLAELPRTLPAFDRTH
jgi:hypothetical protein